MVNTIAAEVTVFTLGLCVSGAPVSIELRFWDFDLSGGEVDCVLLRQ